MVKITKEELKEIALELRWKLMRFRIPQKEIADCLLSEMNQENVLHIHLRARLET
jgi:hypothetical protein